MITLTLYDYEGIFRPDYTPTLDTIINDCIVIEIDEIKYIIYVYVYRTYIGYQSNKPANMITPI